MFDDGCHRLTSNTALAQVLFVSSFRLHPFAFLQTVHLALFGVADCRFADAIYTRTEPGVILSLSQAIGISKFLPQRFSVVNSCSYDPFSLECTPLSTHNGLSKHIRQLAVGFSILYWCHRFGNDMGLVIGGRFVS